MATGALQRIFFDLSASSQGFLINTGLRIDGWLVFNNFTPYLLSLQFQDGTLFTVYPGQANALKVNNNETTITCNFIRIFTGPIATTVFYVDVYDITADPSLFTAYPTQASAFISGGTAVSTSNLVNDGNGNQQIIESTIAGNSTGTSNVSVYNSGLFSFMTQSYGTYTATPNIQLFGGGAGIPAELELYQTFLFFNDPSTALGIMQSPIFITMPDLATRQIHFNGNTYPTIDWGRTTQGVLSAFDEAFSVSREGVGGFTAKTLFLVDTRGNTGVGAHLLSSDTATPTIAAGTGLGTGGTVSIAGTDTRGIITVNTGTGPVLGSMGVVTFANPYTFTPVVFLLYQSSNVTGILYVNNVTTTGFTAAANAVLVASITYQVGYLVIG